jgi:cyclase
LLSNGGLVKTVKFKRAKYVGDPINIVKIFNEKEVDELVFLDIDATFRDTPPPFELLERVAGEAFMPMAYGGGLRSLHDVKRILSIGFEKIVINTYAVQNPAFVTAAADLVGSQSVVVSIDVKKNLWRKYEVYTHGGRKVAGLTPVTHAKRMERAGAGELLLSSIDRDGTMQGYDLDLTMQVTGEVSIPVIVCGGARTVDDLASAIKIGGASAAAAGSMFVFHGPHRAVLVTYPRFSEIQELFEEAG